MFKKTLNYKEKAKKRWKKHLCWIVGDGRYALLAHCRVLTITLWKNLEDAEKRKAIIDKHRCGGWCVKAHEIIDLDKKRIRQVYKSEDYYEDITY